MEVMMGNSTSLPLDAPSHPRLYTPPYDQPDSLPFHIDATSTASSTSSSLSTSTSAATTTTTKPTSTDASLETIATTTRASPSSPPAASKAPTKPSRSSHPCPRPRPRQRRHHPAKLKLSCDQCAQRKIRCPRDQPVCERCAKHGLECRYSVAQRYGKPKKAVSAAVEQNRGGKEEGEEKGEFAGDGTRGTSGFGGEKKSEGFRNGGADADAGDDSGTEARTQAAEEQARWHVRMRAVEGLGSDEDRRDGSVSPPMTARIAATRSHGGPRVETEATAHSVGETDTFAITATQFLHLSPMLSASAADTTTATAAVLPSIEAMEQTSPVLSSSAYTSDASFQSCTIRTRTPLTPPAEPVPVVIGYGDDDSFSRWPETAPAASSMSEWDYMDGGVDEASNGMTGVATDGCGDSTTAAAATRGGATQQAALQTTLPMFPSGPAAATAIWGRDCFQRVCEAFQTLKQTHEAAASATAATACLLEPPVTTAAAQFVLTPDYVGSMLQTTCHVIEEAAAILQCPCHRTAKVRCALTMLLLEVVSSYEELGKQLRRKRAVEGAFGSASSYVGGRTGNRAAGPDAEMGVGPSGGMFVPPVAVGTTMLNQCESAAMLAEFMLSKIRRIQGMTKMLSVGNTPSSLQSEIVLDSAEDLLEALKAEM